MFNLQHIQESAKQFLADNASTILTAGGAVGVVGTGVLAWRGGYKAGLVLRDTKIEKFQAYAAEKDPDKEIPLTADVVAEMYDSVGDLSTQEKVRLLVPHAIPPIISGGATIAAIIFSHRMSAQKAAALAALYGVSQKQFEEYREKVQEKITGPKAKQIDDELAQDRVNNTPGSSQIIVIEGRVLCFDEPTGRYFESSIDDIRRAVNQVNEMILHEDGASASMFYDLIGLPETTWSQEVGFNMDNMCDLSYSYVEGEGGKPCLSINFKNMPVYEYHRRY